MEVDALGDLTGVYDGAEEIRCHNWIDIRVFLGEVAGGAIVDFEQLSCRLRQKDIFR